MRSIMLSCVAFFVLIHLASSKYVESESDSKIEDKVKIDRVLDAGAKTSQDSFARKDQLVKLLRAALLGEGRTGAIQLISKDVSHSKSKTAKGEKIISKSNKVDTARDCTDSEWESFTVTTIDGGTNIGATSLEDCKSACLNDLSCRGVAYTVYSTGVCSLISTDNENEMTIDWDSKYYELERGSCDTRMLTGKASSRMNANGGGHKLEKSVSKTDKAEERDLQRLLDVLIGAREEQTKP